MTESTSTAHACAGGAARRRGPRLAVVTSTMPYGTREAFLVPELARIAHLADLLLIIPMRPGATIVHEDARPLESHTLRQPLLSWRILRAALREMVRRPVRATRGLALLLTDPRPRILAKNLAIYAKALWLASVVREARIEHVHAHWAATTASLAMLGAEVAGVPWSFTAHRWDIAERNLLRPKMARAAFVRAISREGASALSAQMPSGCNGPIVIHMGVTLPAISAARRPEPAATCRILVPANLVEKKGHRFLLDAVRQVANRGIMVGVDLAGDGPLQAELERQAAALQLTKHVSFCGAIPHERLLHRLAQQEWDVIVLPSIVTRTGEHEGIPVSLMEAMAHGIPVIATDSGGIPELVAPGAGLLVPPEDPLRLADAIAALATDPEARTRYGAAGRARVRDAFGVEATVDTLLDHITACTTGGP